MRNLVLPPVIVSPEEVFSLHLPPSQPNFITVKSVTAQVATVNDPPESFAGRTLFVPSADPGFDWIFLSGHQRIRDPVRRRNSHMAIRANELGIPAVIGAGRRPVPAMANRMKVAPRLHELESAVHSMKAVAITQRASVTPGPW